MLEAQGVDFDTAFIQSQIQVERELLSVMDRANVCLLVPVAGCSGFGRSSPMGSPRDVPIPLEFDEQSLFTRLRASAVAQLTDASVLQTLVIPFQP